MTTATATLLEAIRADIKHELREEILSELRPEIERRLYANVFTFAEAVQYLKVSISTLRRMVKDGEIPHFKQRENVYFRQIDLDKWIKKRLVGKEVYRNEIPHPAHQLLHTQGCAVQPGAPP